MVVAWLLLALHVQSGAGCPAGTEVERQLGPLLGDDVAVRDVAILTPAAGGGLSLSLADPGGQVVGSRVLPAARTCDEQAKAVAVTLAVWEAQLHPEISLALDRLQPEPPAPAELPTVVRAAMPRPPARALAWTLGVAAAGDLQSSTWAPAARLELGLGPAESRWRARLAVAGVGRHQRELAPGTVVWRRAYLQLGAEVGVAEGRHWGVVLGAGALGGVASISGAGFAVDRSTGSFELGGEGRARVEARLGTEGHVRPWVGGAVAMWARRQELEVQGGSSGAALPRVEPMATLGADFAW